MFSFSKYNVKRKTMLGLVVIGVIQFVENGYLPKTIANVLVALRSFFADDFSRFFFDAL